MRDINMNIFYNVFYKDYRAYNKMILLSLINLEIFASEPEKQDSLASQPQVPTVLECVYILTRKTQIFSKENLPVQLANIMHQFKSSATDLASEEKNKKSIKDAAANWRDYKKMAENTGHSDIGKAFTLLGRLYAHESERVSNIAAVNETLNMLSDIQK